jgi:tetratricopeptide (TPR) repeat protein
MDEAEAHNAAGNDAFNAGNYQKASELYFAAVKANGKIAKYRTNLCNALLKRGKPAEAVEEAAAAVAVDASWPKGHYYKALAYEALCKLPEALAACEDGLRIHRCRTRQRFACPLLFSCVHWFLCRSALFIK